LYLKKTKDLKLKYSKKGNLRLIGYSDSDWGGDMDQRKSTTRYVFMLGGAAISWSSKKQQSVALSATEAEYMASAAAAQEAIYLRYLLGDLECPQEGPTLLFEDNKGSIAMAKNYITSRRTKHIEIRHHFIRGCVERKFIEVRWMQSEQMLADILTKVTSKATTDQHIKVIMGQERHPHETPH